MIRIALAIILAVSLGGALSIPVNAQDYNFTAEGKEFKFRERGGQPPSGPGAVDAAAFRPLGLATVIAGTAIFIVTLPFTAPGGNVGAAAENLIVRPGGWTFDRPLGVEKSKWDEPPLF
jgi:hypothetical protein